MVDEGVWANIEAAALSLPGCGDDLFKRLWTDRGLRSEVLDREADAFDEYSARLVCANTFSQKKLYIGLPDDSPHRPALLFATALIRYWYNSRPLSGGVSQTLYPPVLYFGSEVGIREQLSQVRVRNRGLNLAEVFRQNNVGSRGMDVGRQRTRIRADGTLNLPRVLTVYSPADPTGILKRHRPEWIAVDCADAPDPRWLLPLLHAAREEGTWVVAWGHNPLSECVPVFRRYGEVFSWPSNSPANRNASLESSKKVSRPENLADLLSLQNVETGLSPTVLSGTSVDRFDELLGEARRRLLRCSGDSLGSLGVDAIRIHWRCLNALATLPVPLDFYENEAPHIWGLEPIGKLIGACEAFSEACERSYPGLADKLKGAELYLRDAAQVLKETETPMWSALSHLCIEEPVPGKARVIAFSGGSRK